MNKAKYREKYGVDKNDPCSRDGLPAPITNTGRYGHVPLDGESKPQRLQVFAAAVLNKLRGK